jgi:divalent metal cation (Fe/Co/Zn/Cd) transporter
MKKTKHLAGWGRTTFLLMAAVSLLLFMTGVVMFVLPVSELLEMPPAQTSWRHAAGVVHGISTWLFCIMCGRGVWPHVRVMWHKQNETMKWALGLMNLVLLVVIALGGLALLYGSPDLHDWVSPLHFWMGAVCPLVFLAHTWRRFIPSKFEPNL